VNAIRLVVERRFVAFVVLLYLAKAAIRVAVSTSLGWDESELTLHAQHAALGYGAQPPLYMWLQWAVFTVFGASLAALTLADKQVFLVRHILLSTKKHKKNKEHENNIAHRGNALRRLCQCRR